MVHFLDRFFEISGEIVWGPHMLILLIGTGIFFTFRLRGLQFHRLRNAAALMMLGVRRKDRSADKKGDITPLQALMTSTSAVVGNGNIAGVATAIALGGPGAVFWMWITGFVGMATKFSEVMLGVHFREYNPDGTILGGPMLYLREAIKWKNTGKLFSLFFAFAIGLKALLTTSMQQSNSITLAVESHIGIERWIVGLVLALLTWAVIVGGIKSIGRIAEFIAPAMSLVYIIGGSLVLIVFWKTLPEVFMRIFSDAFSGTAAAGGFAGATLMNAMRFGIARGSYSNEAGTGSSPFAHAAAKTDEPVRQGLIAMLDVFIDTIILCTITALVILSSGQWLTGTTSTELATSAFETGIPFGGWIVVLSSLLFGYSSLISWPYIGEQAWAYLFGFGIKKYYRWGFCLFVFLGSIVKVNTVWLMVDTMNGVQAVPNLIGILLLSGVVVRITGSYLRNGTKTR
ncbi:alanine/glycine:cation symporter family protein [candidate division KSB1 bacterium]